MTTAAAVLAGGMLRYSTVWEDHRLLERGLGVRPGDDLIVIASAGDNVLNLLLSAPRRIVALDVNPAQTALVELHRAGVLRLAHHEYVALIGAASADAEQRLALYERVRGVLSESACAWWDANAPLIESGIVHAGRLDRYIAGFRDRALKTHTSRAAIEELLSSATPAEQHRAAERLITPDFVASFREYFTAEHLGGRGRDPSQMRYVGDDVDVTAHFLARLRWVCGELPIAGNVYLERFLRGAGAATPFLFPDNFARLRRLVPRVEIVEAELGEYLDRCPARSLSHAALSDLFEYVSESATADLAEGLARALRPQGRTACWNLFVHRALSSVSMRFDLLSELSARLFAEDRAWFYRAFHVEELVA